MWALWTAFFVSGVAGLSYELTWVRYLTHVFGATTPAVAATVAVFFAGTALGSALGARWFSRHDRPVLAYAGLEASIGVVGLLLPTVFGWLDAGLAAREGTQSLGELLLASGLVLLLPTVLLGATFPAMIAAVRRRVATTHGTARVYGLNTLGAVLGCLFVSFWWLPALGLRTTSMMLAAINLAVAAAVVVAWRVGLGREPSEGLDESDGEATAAVAVIAPRRALLLALGSGFVAIAVEVQWVRALALSFPATVYTFALVLSAYLVGIGLGSAGVARLYRARRPRPRDLLAAYVAAGLGCLLVLNLLPQVSEWTLGMLASSLRSFDAYLSWVGGISVAVMLPATLAMGAALPILVGLATGPSGQAARVAGRIYGANTLGGVLGSLGGTFWLMPQLGLSRSLALMALGYLALALVVPAEPKLRTSRQGLAAVLALGSLVVVLDLQPEVNALRHRPDAELLFYEDTPSGTVAVYEHADGTRALRINNQYTLSNTSPPTVRMQSRLGRIPGALHPAPRRALLIGFATGTTLAAMASSDAIEQLDCVEIHDVVFSLAPHFAAVNRQVWNDPRVHLVRGDGRRHLARSGPSYDLVVADLFVPRNPGVGALYSVDHFQAVQRRLSEGGMFVVWLPLWQLGPDELGSIVGSFLAVFPQAEGWVGEHGRERPILGLVGGATPATEQVQLPPLAPGAYPEVARRALGSEQLRRVAGDASLNTLDLPVVEHDAPRSTMQARISGEPLLPRTLQRLAGETSP